MSSSTKRQFDVLCKLMHRADVDRIVCATDAGREGELIFRLVYHQCGVPPSWSPVSGSAVWRTPPSGRVLPI